MKNIIWGIIAVLVIAFGVYFWQGNQLKSKDVNSKAVKIGAVLPITGWGAYWGEGEQRGIDMAVKEIKSAGGDIEVVVEDGGTDATKSATAAQKLISSDNVQGMFTEFTGPSTAISPILAKSKLPFLYDAFTKKPLTDNPNSFKMYFDAERECGVAAKYFAGQGKKHIGALVMNLDFTTECKSGIDAALTGTGTTVNYYYFNTDVTDFRTFIAKMKTDKVDSIINVAYEDNAFNFFKQKADLGLTVPVFAAAGRPDNFTEKIYKGLPITAINNTVTYDQEVKQSFIDKVKGAYPDIKEKDILTAAYGYEETMYLYRGISACLNSEDPECFSKYLLSHDDYDSALQGSGFNQDRVVKLKSVYMQFIDGNFKTLDL